MRPLDALEEASSANRSHEQQHEPARHERDACHDAPCSLETDRPEHGRREHPADERAEREPQRPDAAREAHLFGCNVGPDGKRCAHAAEHERHAFDGPRQHEDGGRGSQRPHSRADHHDDDGGHHHVLGAEAPRQEARGKRQEDARQREHRHEHGGGAHVHIELLHDGRHDGGHLELPERHGDACQHEQHRHEHVVLVRGAGTSAGIHEILPSPQGMRPADRRS